MSFPVEEKRYLCSQLVSLVYEDRYHHTQEAIANLEEISPGEVHLLTEERLEPDLPVQFRANDQQFHGQVKSSSFEPHLGWFVKIALAPASRWSPHQFVPEHLLMCAPTMSASIQAA